MNIFNFVKSNLSIVDVFLDYMELKEVDGLHKGLCPFEGCDQERKKMYIAGFVVNPDKQVFYCFYCHKGGDVISFVQEMKSITPNQAVLFLIETYILKKK